MGIAEEILRALEPTEEDLSIELTNDQLMKLCRRNRCRVDMWKWNVVEDFAQTFRDTGRFKGRSIKFIHKLLIKAYQRNQELFRQTEMDKNAEQNEEWAYRKKNALLQLDMWEREEKMQNVVESNDVDMTPSEERAVLQQQFEKETLLNTTRSSNSTYIEDESLEETNSLSLTVLEREEEFIDVGTETEAFAVEAVTLYQSIVKETQTRNKEQRQKQNTSEEDASIVKDVMQINSESITIETDTLTDGLSELQEQSHEELITLDLSRLQETPLQPIVETQSQETYDDFHERMPFSSTQDAACNSTVLMPVLCLGPKRAGKSHILKALQDNKAIDETSYSVPTIGTSIYNIRFPHKSTNAQTSSAEADKSTTTSATDAAASSNTKTSHPMRNPSKSIRVMEIGGSMAPLWRQYFDNVEKIIYVVDTSNLCQISAAGVLLYSILAEPRLQKVKFLLVLTKMDYAYRQMRNEALLMLQMSKLQKQIRQNITIVEASSVTRDGFDKIYNWLQMP